MNYGQKRKKVAEPSVMPNISINIYKFEFTQKKKKKLQNYSGEKSFVEKYEVLFIF